MAVPPNAEIMKSPPFKSLRRDVPIGLLFDVDGLLIDNTREIHLAYQSLLVDRGIAIQADEEFPGTHLFDILARMKHEHNLSASVEELAAERRQEYLKILSRGTFELCAGAAELFQLLDRMRTRPNVRFAYVSSSEKCFIDILFRIVFQRIGLDRYASDPDSFFYRQNGIAASTSWEVGLEKKPHPMLYELACRKLALDPTQCIAFEDSPSGWHSALEAGLNLVVVPSGKDQRISGNLITEAQRKGRMCQVKSIQEFLPLIEEMASVV